MILLTVCNVSRAAMVYIIASPSLMLIHARWSASSSCVQFIFDLTSSQMRSHRGSMAAALALSSLDVLLPMVVLYLKALGQKDAVLRLCGVPGNASGRAERRSMEPQPDDRVFREEDMQTCDVCMEIPDGPMWRNERCGHVTCIECTEKAKDCIVPPCFGCHETRRMFTLTRVPDPVHIVCSMCNGEYARKEFRNHVCSATACPRQCGWVGVRKSRVAHMCAKQPCVLCAASDDHLLAECPRNDVDEPGRTWMFWFASCIERECPLNPVQFASMLRARSVHPFVMDHVRVACELGLLGAQNLDSILGQGEVDADRFVSETVLEVLSYLPHDIDHVNDIFRRFPRSTTPWGTALGLMRYFQGFPQSFYEEWPNVATNVVEAFRQYYIFKRILLDADTQTMYENRYFDFIQDVMGKLLSIGNYQVVRLLMKTYFALSTQYMSDWSDYLAVAKRTIDFVLERDTADPTAMDLIATILKDAFCNAGSAHNKSTLDWLINVMRTLRGRNVIWRFDRNVAFEYMIVKFALDAAELNREEGDHEAACALLDSIVDALSYTPPSIVRHVRRMYLASARVVGFSEERMRVEKQMEDVYQEGIVQAESRMTDIVGPWE